jgi:hypothetical protein
MNVYPVFDFMRRVGQEIARAEWPPNWDVQVDDARGVVVAQVITPDGVTMVSVALDRCDPRQIGWAVDAIRGRVAWVVG